MKAEEIFLAAIEKDTPDDRAAYLDEACGDDAKLRGQVEGLLKSHEQAGSFLDQPLFDSPATSDQPITEKPGTVIGPYKLLEQIGEGGFGVVYMAEQTEPVERGVALKIIKPGMDTRQVIARFEAERQALALMDHPNIAKVFDAGATESGRPYFVMELVKGIPITEYCDREHLSPKERLDLFIPVCQAVQHAHQKGVIHRDIKPTNVLVALYDGRPVPKVIDFGVAKATSKRLTEKTMFTHFGQIVGTLEYMSPEQAEVNQLDIDTRSDIYSLGVLLYELLTGATPFDRERLRSAAFEEMLRIIREEEPPKPSTRLSTTDALPSIAAQRKTEPRKLSGLVRGDLDWIVMKALEKDRTRRYETANAFARDIQRYLNDEAVEACPPSALYRFRKFARRNRTAVLSTVAIAMALLVGAGIATWQAIVATRAKTFANQQHSLAEQRLTQVNEHRLLAQENFRLAFDAVNQMLTQVAEEQLADVPQMEQVRQNLLQDALAFYQKFLQQKSTDPKLRKETAKAHARVGDIHRLLGQSADAEPAFREAIALLEDLVEENPGRLDLRHGLARSYHDLGASLWDMHRYEEGLKAIRKALEIRRAMGSSETDHQSRLAHCTGCVGMYLQALGRTSEAEKAHRDALELLDKLPADYQSKPHWRSEKAHFLKHLAFDLSEAGRHKEALPLKRHALDIEASLVAEFPDKRTHQEDLALSVMNLGVSLRETGQKEQAEQSFRRAIELYGKLTADFPAVYKNRYFLAKSHWNLAWLLARRGRREEAEGAYQEAISLYQELVAELPDDPELKDSLGRVLWHLADEVRARGEWEQACELLSQAVEHQSAAVKLKPSHPDYARNLRDQYAARGGLNARRGQWQEAAADFAKAVELDTTENEAGSWNMLLLALLRVQIGDVDGYREVCSQMLARFNHTEHPMIANQTAKACFLIPDAMVGQEDLTATLAERAVTLGGPDHPKRVYLQLTKAMAEYRGGRFASAIEWLRKCQALKSQRPNIRREALILLFLAMAHQRLDQGEEARRALAEARQIMQTEFPTLDSGDVGGDWVQWLLCHIIRREAEELIGNEERPTAVRGPPNPDS